MTYLWGQHRVTGRWERLQGPSDADTLQAYQAYFARETLSTTYAHVPHSGFNGDTRPTYVGFSIAAKAPRKPLQAR